MYQEYETTFSVETRAAALQSMSLDGGILVIGPSRSQWI